MEINNEIDTVDTAELLYRGKKLDGIKEIGSSESLDSVSLFMREVSKHPLLSKKETEELIAKAHKGDKEARDELITSNLRLVVSVAKKYINLGLPFLDLVEEGVFGLNRSIDLFEIDKGFRFSTYASVWIRQAITRALANEGRLIRLPTHVQDDYSKVMKARNTYKEENGVFPTNEELSKILNDRKYTPDYLFELNDIFFRTNTDSLDKVIYEDTPLLDTVSSDINEEKKCIDENERFELIKSMLSCLDERSAFVLTKTFGLDGQGTHTLEEVGSALKGISRERVRQIREAALAKLRKKYKTIIF